jgi:c-di-GMP-binding flagellar brake protein YcgR
MKFVAVPLHLRNIFSVSGLDRSIEMYPAEDSAINSFKEDKVIDNIKKLQLRRRFKRLPVDLRVELYPKYNKKASCLKLEILNLSAIGAYIYGCSNFQLGDEVVVRLKLAPKQEEIELDAKVVWLPDKQVQPHAYPGMGVEFHNISKHLQEKLIEFIERNLSFMSTDD